MHYIQNKARYFKTKYQKTIDFRLLINVQIDLRSIQ